MQDILSIPCAGGAGSKAHIQMCSSQTTGDRRTGRVGQGFGKSLSGDSLAPAI